MKRKINLLSLASKGRKGDTEIRRVDGRLSHVNKTEAKWIDNHGQAGEDATQQFGSGTINPETGLMEYGWKSWLAGGAAALGTAALVASGPIGWAGLAAIGAGGGLAGQTAYSAATGDSGGVWRPTQGKWGIFGSTQGAKDADQAKADAAERKASFETFMDEQQDTNVAGIQTPDTNDDTPGAGTDFTEFVKDSGISPTVAEDMNRYISDYDTSQEDKLDLQSEQLMDDTDAAAAQNSQGLLAMVSAEEQNASQRGFANAGSFQQQFARKQARENAERTFSGIDRSRQENTISKGQVQTEYNKGFWDEMMKWSETINA